MDKVVLPAKVWTLLNECVPFPLANVSKMDKTLLEFGIQIYTYY